MESNKNWEGDFDEDLDNLVGFAKTLPGFVRGTWTQPDDNGRALSFHLFSSEEEARAVAEAPPPPDGPVILHEVNVYEVARDTETD